VTWSRAAWFVVALAACDRHDARRAEPQPPARRMIEPPVGIVRPLPPHAIRADGVGPYRLGDKLADLLAQLPSGPRIALLEIPGVVHRSVISAEENDTVLIGGEAAGTASFVAVIGPGVARTDSGIHVGSTRKELEAALGPQIQEPDRAFDPRLAVPTGLRNARIVIDKDRIAAIVIVEQGPPAAPPDDTTGSCTRPAPPPDARGVVIGTCMGPGGERVEQLDAELAVRAVEGDRAFQIKLPAPIVFAAPLRTADGRDLLAVVTRADAEDKRTWALSAFRIEGARLVRTIDASPLYAVTSASARWIGAELRDIDLYLELASRKDAIEVNGLLTTRHGDYLENVIPLVTATRKHGKPE
jgi:hypothetical protein